MRTEELLFIKCEKKYLMVQTEEGFYKLPTAEMISSKTDASLMLKERGRVEENGEVTYKLLSCEVDDPFALLNAVSDFESNPSKLPDGFEWVSEDDLFNKKILPGDKLYIKSLYDGKNGIDTIIKTRGERLVTACERVRVNPFKAFFKHLHTVNRHRRLVRKNCFKVGLYWQGITHDLSKYSPKEFFVGVRFYQGMRSPNVAERMTTGYSTAWMHHKGRNRHHQEYWTDYSPETGSPLEFMPMPKRYFVESIMDRIAACKVYRGKTYTDSAALEYLTTRESEAFMNKKNFEDMVMIFTMLSQKGEEETFRYIKEEFLRD